jgi:peptide-methionine (S)-S-oxide reductase
MSTPENHNHTHNNHHGQSHSPSAPATGLQEAMFGAGCFWGVEVAFSQIPGVMDTSVGYAGGSKHNPTYEQVCTDTTGHAEVVHLTFDPAQVSYETLVEAFFNLHDPTQRNRQGPDIGTQYRSAIFVRDEAQQHAAQAVMHKLAPRFNRPIATTIEPWVTYYKAEEYHQQYLAKRGKTSCKIH